MDETASTTSRNLGEKSTLVVSRKRQAAKFRVAYWDRDRTTMSAVPEHWPLLHGHRRASLDTQCGYLKQ